MRSIIGHISARAPLWLRKRLLSIGPLRKVTKWLLKGSVDLVVTYDQTLKLVLHPVLHPNFLYHVDLDRYEPCVNRAIRQVAQVGAVIWDVGANIGVYTMLMAKGARII